jgi:hypothetical protein
VQFSHFHGFLSAIYMKNAPWAEPSAVGFFENLSQEETNMLAAEWNMEDALRVREEETWEKARKEDRDLFSNLMERAGSMDELKKMFEKSFGGGAEQAVPPPGAGKYAGR